MKYPGDQERGYGNQIWRRG